MEKEKKARPIKLKAKFPEEFSRIKYSREKGMTKSEIHRFENSGLTLEVIIKNGLEEYVEIPKELGLAFNKLGFYKEERK